MTEAWVGFTYQKVREPEPRGERVAAWVEDYLKISGRSLSELAFRLRADKRDLQRLVRDRSVGWRLEDCLAAYFGKIFVDEVFGPVVGCGPSLREQELDLERSEIAGRLQRLRQDRASLRQCGVDRAAADRLEPDRAGQADV